MSVSVGGEYDDAEWGGAGYGWLLLEFVTAVCLMWMLPVLWLLCGKSD